MQIRMKINNIRVEKKIKEPYQRNIKKVNETKTMK